MQETSSRISNMFRPSFRHPQNTLDTVFQFSKESDAQVPTDSSIVGDGGRNFLARSGVIVVIHRFN